MQRKEDNKRRPLYRLLYPPKDGTSWVAALAYISIIAMLFGLFSYLVFWIGYYIFGKRLVLGEDEMGPWEMLFVLILLLVVYLIDQSIYTLKERRNSKKLSKKYEEIHKLISSVDNNAGDHCLWLDTEGMLHMDRLPCEFKNLKYKIRVFEKGDGECGPQIPNSDSIIEVIYLDILYLGR